MNVNSQPNASNQSLPRAKSIEDLSKDQLVEFCKSLSDQLEQSRMELKAQREASREFINRVSHDLHAPWRAISGFAEYLRNDYREQLDDTANEYVNQISLGTERMKRQFHGLMKIAEISIVETNSETVDLNKSLEDAKFTLIQQIEDCDAKITSNPLPKVVGDNNQLRLLFENLISNSLRFCTERKPLVHISVKQDLQNTIVSISDNGNGMSARECERSFEVFRCGNTENEARGRGVGLTLCRRIAEQHHSSIWIESEPGVGTTVHFSLPQRALHSANIAPDASKSSTALSRPKLRSHAKYAGREAVS